MCAYKFDDYRFAVLSYCVAYIDILPDGLFGVHTGFSSSVCLAFFDDAAGAIKYAKQWNKNLPIWAKRFAARSWINVL